MSYQNPAYQNPSPMGGMQGQPYQLMSNPSPMSGYQSPAPMQGYQQQQPYQGYQMGGAQPMPMGQAQPMPMGAGQPMPMGSAPPMQGGSPPGSPTQEAPPPYQAGAELAAMQQANSGQYFDAQQQAALFGPPPDYNTVVQNAPSPQAQLQAPQGYQAQSNAAMSSPKPILQIQPNDAMQTRALQFLPGCQQLQPVYLPSYSTEVNTTGVVAHDDALNSNVYALAGFFARFNTPPTFQVHVRGHHTEHRHRTVKDSNGNTRHETYTVDVTDFSYSVDASRFIWPLGMMQVLPDKTGRQRNLFEVLTEYSENSNKLKNITMYKSIGWNFSRLHRLVHDGIRAMGWWRLLDIGFPMQNGQVTARSNSSLSNVWNNKCIRCLCIFPFFIPFGAIWFTCMCCYSKNFDDSLRSHFAPWCTEDQFFLMNRYLFVPFGSGNVPVISGSNAATGGEGCCHRSCPEGCNCPRDC